MGNISVLGGTFTDNESFEKGGVFHGEDSSLIVLKGGSFQNNRAQDGAVAAVRVDSALLVVDGVYTGNVAERQGGVFSSYAGGGIQVRRISIFASSLILAPVGIVWRWFKMFRIVTFLSVLFVQSCVRFFV